MIFVFGLNWKIGSNKGWIRTTWKGAILIDLMANNPQHELVKRISSTQCPGSVRSKTEGGFVIWNSVQA